MSTGTAVATTENAKPKSVIAAMATRYGMEPAAFEATVRATCMPQGHNVQPMTREEFAAGIMVAEKYTLNPILREIYFYPRKGGGIVPVVSIDGWLSLINRRKELDGIEFDELHDDKGKLVSITCRIYRTDRKHPTIVTEHLSECYRETIPWKMPHRMLRHKALIQCARYAFGFAGIHDEDEAERIVDAVAQQQITGPAAPPPADEPRRHEPAPPAETARGPAAPPVEEAEIVELKPAGANMPQEEHELLTEAGVFKEQDSQQEEPFDAEAWLDEVRDRFAEARTTADIDGIHEMFGDTAGELGRVEAQKYQDMHEAAMLRVEVKEKPEAAEVTGEPGPAPADDEEDDGFPGADSIKPAAPPPPSPGQAYIDRIRQAINDPIRTQASLEALWNATADERKALVADGHLTKEQRTALRDAIAKRGQDRVAQSSPGPVAPPSETDEVTAYDRAFRQRVEACTTIEEINALSTGTLGERAKFQGNPIQRDWQAYITQKRKQISGIAG